MNRANIAVTISTGAYSCLSLQQRRRRGGGGGRRRVWNNEGL